MEILLAYLHVRALRRERRYRDRVYLLQLSNNELIPKYRFLWHELILLFEEM